MPGINGVLIDGRDRDNVRWLTFIILFALSFAVNKANANPLVLDAHINKFDLSGHLTYLRDPDGSLTLDDVTSQSQPFVFLAEKGNLNFGITSDVIWLRLEVQRAPSAAAEWWLELAPAYIGEATLYEINRDGGQIGKQGSSAGIMLPLSVRDFKTRHSTFKIILSNTETHTFYLKIRSNTQLNVRGYIWQPAFFAEKNASENLYLGIYYGAFALIVIICGLRLWINWNPVDLWWLLYLLAEGFVVFRMNGLASHYFFPEFPLINTVAGTLSLSLMVFAGSFFGIHAFALKKNNYRYSLYAARGIGALALFFGIARLINLEPASTICLFVLSFLLCLLSCVFSYRFLKSGELSAKFYFSGIWFMTGCVVLVLARNFGLMPAFQFIDYVWQSNVIVHASLMSYGMVLAQRQTAEERRRATDYRENAEINEKYTTLQKRMMALVSHEFRNSLAMLNVSMHVMSKRKDLPSEVSERHQNIIRVHHQMRKVIDNFLMEERIQNATLKVLYERTEMSIMVREVINLAELHGKNQIISADIQSLPRYLRLDEGILRFILTNLLDNAVKYSDPKSKIKMYGQYNDGLLRMSVSDNGIGMNEDSLARLFEPHFKANLRSEGVGIGLYMVKMLLHAHEGDLRVTSAIGSGSTIEFWMRVDLINETFSNPQVVKRSYQ